MIFLKEYGINWRGFNPAVSCLNVSLEPLCRMKKSIGGDGEMKKPC